MSDTTLSETHITQDNGISIQNSSDVEKKWGSNKEEIEHVDSGRHRSKEETVAQMTVPCVTEKTNATSSIVTEEADEQITEATAVKNTAKGRVTEPRTEHSLGSAVSLLKEGHMHESITAVDSKEDLPENAASMPCQSLEQQTVAECAETENPVAVLEKCSGSANPDDATATANIIRLTHSYVKTPNTDTKPEKSTVTPEISKPSTYEHELESNVSSTTESVNSSPAEISEKDVVITEQDTCPLVVETSYDYTHTVTSPEVQSIAEVVIPMSSDDGMHNRESHDSTCKQPNQSESALSFSSSSVNAPTDTSSSVNTPSNTSSSVNVLSDTSSTVNVLSDTTSSVNALSDTPSTVNVFSDTTSSVNVLSDTSSTVNVLSDTSSTVNVLSDTTSSVNAPSDTSSTVNVLSDTSSTVNVLSDISTSVTQKKMQDSTKSINSTLLQKKQGNQKSSQKPGGKLTSLLQRLPLVSNQAGAKGSSTSTKLVIKHDTIVNNPTQSNTSSLFGDSPRVTSKEESLTQDKPPTSASQNSAVCLPQTSQGLSHQNVSSITQLPLFSLEKSEDNSATTQFRHQGTKRISVKIIKSDESQKPDFEVCSNSPSTTSAANNKQTAISHTTAHVFLDARKDDLPKQHLFSPEVTAVVASGHPSFNVAEGKRKSLHCLISSGNLEGPVSVYKGKKRHIPLVEGSSEADPKPVPVQTATVKPRPQISLLQTPGSKHLVFKSMSGSTKSPAAYSLLANSFTTPNPRFRFTHPTSEAAGVSISTPASTFLPVVGMQGSAKPSIVPYLGPNTLLLAPPYQLPAGSQIIFQPVPCAVVTSGQTKTSVLTTPVHTKITTTPVASQISTVKTGVQPLSSAPQAIASSTQPVTSSVLLVPTSQATSRTTILTISTRNNSKSDVPCDTSNRSKKAVIFEHAKPEKASTTTNKGPQLNTTSSSSTHQIYSKLITRIVEQSLLGASADKNVLSQLQGAQVAVSQSALQQTPQSVISAKSNTASSLKIVNSHDLRLQTSSNSQSLQAVKVSDKSTRISSPSLKISTKDMSFMSEVAQTTRTVSTVNNSNLKSVVISSKPMTVPAISSGETQSVQQQPQSLKLFVPTTSKAISLLNTSYRTETQNSIVLPFQSDTTTASNPSVKRMPRSKAVKSTNSQIITKRDLLQPSTKNPLQNPSSVADFKRLFTVPNTGTKSKNSIYSATLSTGQGLVPVKVVVPDVDDDSSDATSDTEIPKHRLPKALATLDKDSRTTASNKDVFSDNKTDIQISDLRGHVEPDISAHGAESVAIYVDEESDSDLDMHNIEEQDMSVLRELLMGAKSTRLSEDPAEMTYQAQVERDQRTDEADFNINSKSVPKIVQNSFTAQEVSNTADINVNSSSGPEVVPSIYLAHEVPCSDKAEGHLSSISTSFEEPPQSSFKSKEQSGPEVSDVLGQPVKDIPKDKNMGQSFREMLQDDITEQTIRELPEGDIAGQKIRELPEDITGQTIRELPEDDIAGQATQELHENDITGQSVTDLPEDDQFCALKIESVFSLSGSVDTEDTEFQTDNSNAQSEFETFSNRQEQVFNVRESDDWKRIIYSSFVVLERMSRSEILGAVRGDIPSKCSGHCRKRTLDYLCNLDLLTCMNHPDSSLFLKPKKLRVVAKRSLRKITKHELVNKKPYANETLVEPYTPCSLETTVLHKEKPSESSSPSMGETPQPSTAPDTYFYQAEGSLIPVKDDQKVDDKISPHLNVFISSSELKEFQADLEQLQEQVDRKRTKMQSEKLSRRMKEVAVVKNKNKTIHKKNQETFTTKTMPTLSDSNVNSTGRSFSEDISANKIHLGSLPKVGYSSSGKNVSSEVVSAQQAIPPNERKEKIIKISPATKRSARILMPKPRTEKNVPAVDIKGSNAEVKSQTNASTAAVPGNTSPTVQSLPTGKIKAALESLTSYLAATGRKPTEGNTQYILLKIEDQHVLVKLPSSSSSTAQLGKTKLSRVKTVSVKSSPADQSLIGDLRKTSHRRGQLNIAKTISSINTSSRVSKTASNLNIAPAISGNNTASDLTKSVSSISGAPAVSGSVSSKNSTIFAKTVSILNAKTMASAKAASEVSKMASNKTPLPSGSEKIDDAEKLRLCTKKITAHVFDGGVTEKMPLHAAKAISRKTGVFVPSSQQTDDISVLQGHISESRNGFAMEVTNVDEITSSQSSKIFNTQRPEVRAVSAASDPTVPLPDLISSAVSDSSLRGSELSNVVLSCLPSNSALLPERRIKRSSPLTQEERTAKRRRLEAKYPLPPGVVIKAEPDDSDYASSINRPDSSQGLFSGDISIASTSQMVSCDSQVFLDQTWSVENFDDCESSLTLSTNVEDQISASRRNVGFVDFPVNSSSYLEEQILPTELFESEEGSSEELDEPPALVDETMTSDPNHHPQEDEVIDILEDTPPVLQPMFTSSSALAEDRDIIELKNTDLFKDKSTHLKVLSSSRSEMIPALRDSVIATESSSDTSLLSQSSLDSGIDTSIPSSSTSYTSIAGTSKTCLSNTPRYKNQKILHLRELLKKKEMEIENIKRMRSEFPSLDLDNV